MSLSFRAPLSPAAFKNKAGSHKITALSASFPNFVDGTNLNSDYPMDAGLSYEENLARWRAFLLRTLDQQQQVVAQDSTSTAVDSKGRIDALRKRIGAGEIDVIGGSLEGAGKDVQQLLEKEKGTIYAVGESAGPAPLPPDEATRSIKSKVCKAK